MTKRDRLPHPDRLIGELAEIDRFLARRADIVAAYRLCWEMRDPRTGGMASIGGSQDIREDGSVTGYVPEAAVESDLVASYVWLGQGVWDKVVNSKRQLGNALGLIEKNKNTHLLGGRWMQPPHEAGLGLKPGEFKEAVESKRKRGWYQDDKGYWHPKHERADEDLPELRKRVPGTSS